MNTQRAILMSLFVLALPLSVNAKALEGEPEWEARKIGSGEKQTERERLLLELKRLQEAERAEQERLDNDA
ncbi:MULTISPECIES: hypothetical protein [unclassified Shewanella]|uniref:hypothetical protein n=1 Tax=unclassified Shewanella TaxID=196818 RepID=UPI001BBA4C28|nr:MULTISPECIES: hypothetical protein [unclassified Shewanella]GIU13459.1 hypothetical protein TUM4444_22030 [Shewanella sp. MBTL60-112-B1]GIU27471.1 hypothetical protein TUM4445_07680 [Shewanella sp. MBTL60-112-B2]